MFMNYLFMTCAMDLSEHVLLLYASLLQRDTHLENIVVVITKTT